MADAKRSTVYVSVNEYRNGIAQAKDRGVKIRFLTEITKDNILYCKRIMQYVNELRHLEGVQNNIALSESEYNASVSLQEERLLVQTIYSILEPSYISNNIFLRHYGTKEFLQNRK